jgi:uncharacterized protein YdhG (YjbR/CyaY superfamily)
MRYLPERSIQNMKEDVIKNKNVKEYVSHFPVKVRVILNKIRIIAKKESPDAVEVISYNMPAFKYNGILIYFAAFKKHIGLYPMTEVMEHFKKEIKFYKHSKGAIQFALDKPVPYGLIRKIVKFRTKLLKQKGRAV